MFSIIVCPTVWVDFFLSVNFARKVFCHQIFTWSVGLQGIVALVYEPDQSPNSSNEMIDLDLLANQTKEVLQGDSEELIAELLALKWFFSWNNDKSID